MKRIAALSLLVACARIDAAEPLREVKAALGEASAVVALANGRFAVADDERGVLLVEPAASGAASVKPLAAINDLEGLGALPDGRLLAVAEQSGALTAVHLDGKTESLGALAHPPAVDASGKPVKAKKNKGWEGVAFLPAALAHDKKDHLVAVHEDKPKAVAVFAWPLPANGQPEAVHVLSGALDAAMGDLADVDVDPKTGELLLVSDESRRLLRASLGPAGIVEKARLDLPVGPDEKPEGIAVDDAGALWIVTDATSRLIRLP